MGLTIARAIVDLHGGKIKAQGAGLNRGATFIVELPGAAAPPHGVTDTTRLSAVPMPVNALKRKGFEAGGSSLRLLLVEDHAPTLQVVATLLTRDGHYVVTASTIAEALAASATDTFNLVIADLGLPDGTGNQLMEKLRDAYGLRGIALSGYGMEEDIERSREAGFVTHLIKPVHITGLRQVLAKLS